MEELQMSEDNKLLLERNWEIIENRVILPLWKKQYETMYTSLKLDYDDFLSMAGYELSKAISSYDNQKSNICTFATNVIKRKANTELRDYGSRDKRKTLSVADSLNTCVDYGDVRNVDIPFEEQQKENSQISEKRVGEFLIKLSNQQLRILILKLLDFDLKDVPFILNITKRSVNDSVKGLKSNELQRILYRRNYKL